MAFTRDELKQELRDFMVGLARSAERIFGSGCGGALLGLPGRGAWDIEPEDARLDNAWLWQAVTTMYDYGIEGQPHPSFGAGGDIGNMYGEAEEFLVGLDSLALFLEEDDVRIPRLARRTVLTAVARHVLDGGERYTTREEDEKSGYLSFAEVALLADMDERSVRNAANPKLPGALVTKNFGRRSMIAIEDARRWLANRKGFVLTRGAPAEPQRTECELSSLTVPYEIAARISDSARDANLSTAEFIAQLLDKHDGESQ